MIEPQDQEWLQYHSTMYEEMKAYYLNQSDAELSELEALDLIYNILYQGIDQQVISPDLLINVIGTALGNYLQHQSHFTWNAFTDEYGRSLGLQLHEKWIFPHSYINKLIEQQEAINSQDYINFVIHHT